MKRIIFVLCVLSLGVFADSKDRYSEINKIHSRIVRGLYPLSAEQTNEFSKFSKARRDAFIKLYRFASKSDAQ